MLGCDTVHPSVVQLHNVVVAGNLVMNRSCKNESQRQSCEDGVTQIKNWAYVKDFLKGITKNEKYCTKVLGSVEQE